MVSGKISHYFDLNFQKYIGIGFHKCYTINIYIHVIKTNKGDDGLLSHILIHPIAKILIAFLLFIPIFTSTFTTTLLTAGRKLSTG